MESEVSDKPMRIPRVLLEMPGPFRPDSYAVLQGCPHGWFSAKIVRDAYAHHLWVELYKGDLKVFDCNPTFFQNWFMSEVELAETAVQLSADGSRTVMELR
jgi:hypothetical protein